MLRFVKVLASRSVRAFQADHCTLMAAAISYYALLSLFPLLIFAVGMTGLFLRNEGLQRDVIDQVLEFVPFSEDEGRDAVAKAVRSIANTGSSSTLGVLGLLGAAWGGGGPPRR